ncbi:MAG: succinylglutamate desuccinylase/aspartoacylase family protein [Acidobacteriota bacterium]
MPDSLLAEPVTATPHSSSGPTGLPGPEPDGTWPRRLGEIVGRGDGPTLLCLAGVHGNEPAGVLGARRVLDALARDASGLVGRLVVLIGNRQALVVGRRFVTDDLNRHWSADRVERLRRLDPTELAAEDRELRELDQAIREAIDGVAEGALFAVDLHTISGQGPGFVVLDDTLPNREFALDTPVTVVVGLEEELSGTVTHHLNALGARVYGFEAGQHDLPESVDHAEAAIWCALESSGALESGVRPEPDLGRQRLITMCGSLPHVVEVRHRHPVHVEDEFRMEPGWINLQAVTAGTVLAHDRNGPIPAPESGLVLMPLYQAQGEDGFFVVRELKPAWLRVSTFVRRANLERFLHLLPGVRRHPELGDGFFVDRRFARFFALEMFHLLGYRRIGPAKERILVMARRRPRGSA